MSHHHTGNRPFPIANDGVFKLLNPTMRVEHRNGGWDVGSILYCYSDSRYANPRKRLVSMNPPSAMSLLPPEYTWYRDNVVIHNNPKHYVTGIDAGTELRVAVRMKTVSGTFTPLYNRKVQVPSFTVPTSTSVPIGDPSKWLMRFSYSQESKYSHLYRVPYQATAPNSIYAVADLDGKGYLQFNRQEGNTVHNALGYCTGNGNATVHHDYPVPTADVPANNAFSLFMIFRLKTGFATAPLCRNIGSSTPQLEASGGSNRLNMGGGLLLTGINNEVWHGLVLSNDSTAFTWNVNAGTTIKYTLATVYNLETDALVGLVAKNSPAQYTPNWSLYGYATDTFNFKNMDIKWVGVMNEAHEDTVATNGQGYQGEILNFFKQLL